MRRVVYVADIGDDVDDMVAILELKHRDAIQCVVRDSDDTDAVIEARIKRLHENGIDVVDAMPPGTDIVFAGGALTKVADYLRAGGALAYLVANGGFVGEDIVGRQRTLPKFHGKTRVRTYNFNRDVNATDYVLRTKRIGRIFLVGKNVCHDARNTTSCIWHDLPYTDVKPHKRLHDLLAVCEGLSLTSISDEPTRCVYRDLYPATDGLDGIRTRWGSSDTPTGYRKVSAATGWK